MVPNLRTCCPTCVHPLCMEARRAERARDVEKLVDVIRVNARWVEDDGPEKQLFLAAVESLANLAKSGVI